MACFWSNSSETSIVIPSHAEVASVTYYKIEVTVGEIKWTVTHRYSEFYDLHNQLVTDHGVSKDILPSKKVIRNKSPTFIESRRKGLQVYLQKVLVFLKKTMPKIFVKFLNLHLFDIFFLLQELSATLSSEADFLLSSNRTYSVSPLELHSISECLKKPFSAEENTSIQFDIGPVVDFCSQLRSLTVIGNSKPYLQSNIILNKLPFELSAFKSLTHLCLRNVSLDAIYSLGSIRSTVVKMQVNYTNAKSVSEILQCDVIHKQNLEGSQKWEVLEELDISNNNLTDIDETISLCQNLKTLILNGNKISTIPNLTHLPNLSHLSITNNLITICNDLHTKVGKIQSLNLAQNSIVTTKGFAKLYSLENLDLSSNKITDIEEVSYLGQLPCLEELSLTGNSVATSVDYRVKVLEFFGENAKSVCLDNERVSQAELDKVRVLRALRIVREGKTPNLNTINK